MKMLYLHGNISEHAGLDDLLNYFDTTCVTGAYIGVRSPADGIPSVAMRRLPHRFHVYPVPHLWTMIDRARTNNICES